MLTIYFGAYVIVNCTVTHAPVSILDRFLAPVKISACIFVSIWYNNVNHGLKTH